jgi:hypothetical protein
VVTPLNKLTRKELGAIRKGNKLRAEESVPIKLTPKVRGAFTSLKVAFLGIPILVYYDPDRPTRVETNTSGCAISGILS